MNPDQEKRIKRNQLKTMSRSFQTMQNSVLLCRCPRNRCTKLYCPCFSNNMACTETCSCIGCKNTPEMRNEAQRMSSTLFCRCAKSSCNNGYCECFKNNSMCSVVCDCRNCENQEETVLYSPQELDLCKENPVQNVSQSSFKKLFEKNKFSEEDLKWFVESIPGIFD